MSMSRVRWSSKMVSRSYTSAPDSPLGNLGSGQRKRDGGEGAGKQWESQAANQDGCGTNPAAFCTKPHPWPRGKATPSEPGPPALAPEGGPPPEPEAAEARAVVQILADALRVLEVAKVLLPQLHRLPHAHHLHHVTAQHSALQAAQRFVMGCMVNKLFIPGSNQTGTSAAQGM